MTIKKGFFENLNIINLLRDTIILSLLGWICVSVINLQIEVAKINVTIVNNGEKLDIIKNKVEYNTKRIDIIEDRHKIDDAILTNNEKKKYLRRGIQ